jgi:N-acetyltransferase
MHIEPIILEGRFVRLEPLSAEHHAALSAVGCDASIWRWNPTQVIRTPEDMRAYIDAALQQQADGLSLPFATLDRAAGHAVGSTRYAYFDPANLSVEIGYTWIAPPWQRTAVNTEAKYLMLRHAFETWGCLRVQLKTDSLNERSRNAIARIGAQPEGILRNHMRTHTGRMRHSVVFSIIDSEWPAVKERLLERLRTPEKQDGAQ